MPWIDTHVHLFSSNDNNEGVPKLHPYNIINTAEVYYQNLKNNNPEGIVVVDFSMSKNSQHVISSLDELKSDGQKAVGIIKGDITNENTLKWLERDDVKGIRVYAKDSVPDISGEKWQEVFNKLEEQSKHILIFGSSKYIVELIKHIPEKITILIDHFGLPMLGEANENFLVLLVISQLRNNIYFKGPGYRSSLKPEHLKPIVRLIVEYVGIDKILLGASDAPFAGPVIESTPEYKDKKYCELMDYEKVLQYIDEISGYICNDDIEKDKILYKNAKELYGF